MKTGRWSQEEVSLNDDSMVTSTTHIDEQEGLEQVRREGIIETGETSIDVSKSTVDCLEYVLDEVLQSIELEEYEETLRDLDDISVESN